MSFSTVWSRWEHNAKTSPERDAIVFWRAGEEPLRWSFKDLFETANKFSVQLKLQELKRIRFAQ